MEEHSRQRQSREVVAAARKLGASLAGLASIAAVRESPANAADESIQWPNWAQSVLVLALSHPPNDRPLDWWDGEGGTPGNRVLIDISERLVRMLQQEWAVRAQQLPYHVEKGGLYLKDAAVVVGLGVIGRNNLLVTPEFGPRVRLRAVVLDAGWEGGEVLSDFAPCEVCDGPCLRACPQNAFAPGRYDRGRCNIQMDKNRANREIVEESSGSAGRAVIKYCRACEIACPVGL